MSEEFDQFDARKGSTPKRGSKAWLQREHAKLREMKVMLIEEIERLGPDRKAVARLAKLGIRVGEGVPPSES